MDRRPRTTLAIASATHFLHDGFADLLYVFFPLWAREFSLSYAQVGLLRTAYSGAMASFQIPAGFLAERWGEARLLAAGTAAVGLGFLAFTWVGGFAALLLLLLAAGLGSGVQHPLGASLTSRAYDADARRVALGTYNFSGDLGKMAVPALVGLAAGWAGWRAAGAGYGVIGLVAAAVLLVVLAPAAARPRGEAAPAGAPAGGNGWGIQDAPGFRALSAIHSIDSATRQGFLTLVPFVLVGKGAPVETVGLALGLAFAGGALGKLACGALAARLGVIRTVVVTEAATCAGMLAVLAAPLLGALAVLPVLGVALNGTSSVLYGSVAEVVTVERRARGYGLFYTVGIGSGAAAPTLVGLMSDAVGLRGAVVVLATAVLVTLPLAALLRRAVAGSPAIP